ncbi:DedA family protein [Morganella morganii]|uniref:DedA family protein n=1 Tax=Morganella morganii TaxID=582 RepID=A0A433ZXQ1_MORMO|nr:DedA family protein [Morganella morganii]RUT66887.1 DedA family protein [Morganella morganii]
MSSLSEIVSALWSHDFTTLSNPEVLWLVYAILFTVIVLENGILPTAFLPGDTLLILSGALIAKGVMDFLPTLVILTAAAGIGSWLGFVQGRWLSDTKTVRRWMTQIPKNYHQKAEVLFNRHGLYALLIGRFLGFVRTLLPMLAGLSTLPNRRFQFFNWLSAFLWVAIITTFGYVLNQIPFVKAHEKTVMTALLLIPVFFLIVGIMASLYLLIRHYLRRRALLNRRRHRAHKK